MYKSAILEELQNQNVFTEIQSPLEVLSLVTHITAMTTFTASLIERYPLASAIGLAVVGGIGFLLYKNGMGYDSVDKIEKHVDIIEKIIDRLSLKLGGEFNKKSNKIIDQYVTVLDRVSASGDTSYKADRELRNAVIIFIKDIFDLITETHKNHPQILGGDYDKYRNSHESLIEKAFK